MIFWLLLAAAVGFAAWMTFLYSDFDWVQGVLVGFISLIVAGFVGGGLLALAYMVPGDRVQPATYELRSLGATESLAGRFYLNYGYVDGVRSLNFVKQVDNWSALSSAHASASRVFEGAESPSVTEYTHSYDNPWVLPWQIRLGTTYDFHVPAGTIREDFAITNQ